MPSLEICPSCDTKLAADARYCQHCGMALNPTARGEAYDLERFFTFALDMLCIAGVDGFFKRVNPAFERVLGYSLDELMSRPFVELIHPDDRHETLREVNKLATGSPTLSFENRYRCKDGSYRHLYWTSFPDPQTGHLYAIARDVTDRRRLEDQLWKPLRADLLTGVADRVGFEEGLDTEWRRACRTELPITVALVDIDGFQPFQEHHGRRVADECLKALSELLTEYTRRPGDLVGRYGGNRFALLWTGGVDEAAAQALGEAIRTAAAGLRIVGTDDSAPSEITVCLGLATCIPTPGEAPGNLIDAAETSLATAKERGPNTIVAG